MGPYPPNSQAWWANKAQRCFSLRSKVPRARPPASGTSVGIVMLIVTASGVFTEMQQTLNVIWKAVPPRTTISALLRARALSLGLVAALGFLLLASLVISAILTALSDYIDALLPSGHLVLLALNFITSFILITILFAAIYKVLPDKPIEWRDVLAGAIVTALLFTVGKFLIGLYLGSSDHRVELRRGWRADHCAPVGLLLGANIFAGRRVHQSVRSPSRQQGEAIRLTWLERRQRSDTEFPRSETTRPRAFRDQWE